MTSVSLQIDIEMITVGLLSSGGSKPIKGPAGGEHLLVVMSATQLASSQTSQRDINATLPKCRKNSKHGAITSGNRAELWAVPQDPGVPRAELLEFWFPRPVSNCEPSHVQPFHWGCPGPRMHSVAELNTLRGLRWIERPGCTVTSGHLHAT